MTDLNYTAKELAAEIKAELQSNIEGEVRFDAFTRTLYSTDASIYQIQPLGVIIPRRTEDVIAAVTIASRHRIPLLPRGGGSSQAGQTVGTALVIDFSRHLDQIIEVNVEERWARVQPGLTLSTLNQHLATAGLKFGPDPSSGNRACLGGIVGNNARSTHERERGFQTDPFY